MSTGLTWAVFTSGDNSDIDKIENSIVFNDYNEAIGFGDWYMRCYYANIGPPRFWIFIYTTSPNTSGFYEMPAGVPVFTPFD
jgi:hypothetical protein